MSAWLATACALLVACSPAHSEPKASEAFCAAASGLEVGLTPTEPERLRIVKQMFESSSAEWQPVIQAGLRSVRHDTDMAREWNDDLVRLVSYIEAACGLNLPRYDPPRTLEERTR